MRTVHRVYPMDLMQQPQNPVHFLSTCDFSKHQTMMKQGIDNEKISLKSSEGNQMVSTVRNCKSPMEMSTKILGTWCRASITTSRLICTTYVINKQRWTMNESWHHHSSTLASSQWLISKHWERKTTTQNSFKLLYGV